MEKPNLRPAPAYQEYASDMLANRTFRLLGLAEKGLLYHMRLEYWVNKDLPSKVDELAKTLGLSESDVLDAFSPNVLSFFKNNGGGLYSQELQEFRENYLAKREKLSESGQKGGKATQSKQKKFQATLEGSLKPLSRAELNRNEMRGEELTKRELTIEESEWVDAYERADITTSNTYLMQSRGY